MQMEEDKAIYIKALSDGRYLLESCGFQEIVSEQKLEKIMGKEALERFKSCCLSLDNL